jgi:signal transduction histidine kinase
VQEIVTAHGGTIDCESTPGVGTVFRMNLPVAAHSVRAREEAHV